MRNFAQLLLAYEAFSGSASDPAESATTRVYGRLRQGLGEFAGVASFHLLASRALALAQIEVSSLSAVRISADGALQGFGEIEHQFDIDKVQAGEFPAGEAGIIFIARFIDLLHIFLGEASTLSLLRVTWPGAAFDDQSSGDGR